MCSNSQKIEFNIKLFAGHNLFFAQFCPGLRKKEEKNMKTWKTKTEMGKEETKEAKMSQSFTKMMRKKMGIKERKREGEKARKAKFG